MLRRLFVALFLVSTSSLAADAATDRLTHSFDVQRPSEVHVAVRAGCGRCDWGVTGREAATLTLSVDGTYSQHLVLARGEEAEYQVSLGALGAGRHQLAVERDAALSAPDAGPASIEILSVKTLPPDSADFTALSMAPMLYARANTVGRFTDLPILMWYEIVPTSRGRQYRYSVIFTNEDGGTATDRLMATWGRTTDIEYVYGVELDEGGAILSEQIQGAGHELPAFKGRHEGTHPLLWVTTDNNMVGESGPARIRYAPVPERFDLRDRSREAVMDAHPWSYVLMVKELAREEKIVASAAAGTGKIPDPRTFAYVEACADVGKATVSIELAVRSPDARVRLQPDAATTWLSSDRGLPRFRIARDGCFRSATPLPTGTTPSDIRALRVVAHDGPVHLSRVNKLFMLDGAAMPAASILNWAGSVTIDPAGSPYELPIR